MARAGLTVDRVVEAAADLADEVGFERVTLSALARHFGVKDASLYSHVKNLQDLRTRVALLAGGELIDRITAAVAGRAGKDALAAFAGAYREYALERPGRYAATQIRVDQDVVAASPASAVPPRSPTACSARTASTNPTSRTPYDCCAAPSTASAPWRPVAASARPGTYDGHGTRPSRRCIWPSRTGPGKVPRGRSPEGA